MKVAKASLASGSRKNGNYREITGIVVMKGEEALFIDDNLNVLRKTSWKEGSDFSFQDLMMDHSVSLDLE
jgi:hypothetical protein